jgi:16S rRNA (guanine(966)-N(2))-methyltransferase RsmD
MVREAVFSILQHVLPDSTVVDLFACSGSMGIEALSRGAESVLFVESNSSAAHVISDNLQSLGIADNAEVVVGDVFTMQTLFRDLDSKFDLAFVDPPYPISDAPDGFELLEQLIAGLFKSHINQDGIAVFRQRKGGSTILADKDGFDCDIRSYGTTQVTFIERQRK